MLTQIEVKDSYKCLTPFVWDTVPRLAVITGINGVGKSHFLHAINNEIERRTHPDLKKRNKLEGATLSFVTDNNDIPSFEKTMHIPANWQPSNFDSSSRSNIDGMRQNFVNWARGKHNPNPAPSAYIRLRSLIEQKVGMPLSDISSHDIVSNIPHDYLEDENKVVMNTHLSSLFVGYILKQKDLRNKKLQSPDFSTLTGAQINKAVDDELGEPPWLKINRLLEKNNFEYQVIYPEDDTTAFQCFFTHRRTKEKINFSDLSSGEKMIVTLILWSYNEQLGEVNDLLLMDEPDAHLHPSMSKLFYKIVSETLVGEYGIQVIVTTHSPSTVALIPENNLFVMSRWETERIKRAASKQEAVNLLTEGLLLVTSNFRIVFVEDENDRSFYETVCAELALLDKLKTDPPLVFKPVSIKKDSGGATKVIEWTKKLNADNPDNSTLEGLFFGLIDCDNKNEPQKKNLFVIDRYSIENYLLDPIIVFAHLLLNEHIEGKRIADLLGYTKGNLSDLYKAESKDLQKIADEIFVLIDPKLPQGTSEANTVDVEFIYGQTLTYPAYLANQRGKDLMKAFNEAFSSPPPINVKELIKTLAITKFIPICLVSKLQELQKIL